MKGLIDLAFRRSRVVTMIFFLTLVAGVYAYVSIPKESAPDVPIPIIYVSVVYPGISPEDSERLLVRPLEQELQSIEGIDEMRAIAAQGYASMTLEFAAGFDADQAEEDVRQAVETAKAELPAEAEEPVVQEVNVALFPVLTVTLSGPISERALIEIAKTFQDRIEALPSVLEAEIGGARSDVLEVLVDPSTLQSYDVSFSDLLTQIQRNNQLIAAGSIEGNAGRLTLKVPGVIENLQDVRSIPVKVSGDTVVTLADVATLRSGFNDPEGFARIDGQPALSLEIRKRIGANIIKTVEAVRAVMDEGASLLPEGVAVTYLQDQSKEVRDTLGDLENNVLTAVILVMIVTVAMLGWRNALLVCLSIPASFFAGIIALWGMGYTLNIIVLFSLILVLGMLVDAAVVTTELADRWMSSGKPPVEAYREASKRMAWPITSSTLTTLCVFFPLLFWQGVVGEFMKFLPITVIIILIASLAVGLIFIPVLGGLFGRRNPRSQKEEEALTAAESGNLDQLDPVSSRYASLLRHLLHRPGVTLFIAFLLLAGATGSYVMFGRGVEFFPQIEPRILQVTIKARDNLSIYESDQLVRRVGDTLSGISGIEHIYTRTTGRQTRPGQEAADTIGVLQLDLVAWDQRRRAAEIVEEVRDKTTNLPGIAISVEEQQSGPGQGKPIQLRLAGQNVEQLEGAAIRVRELMAEVGGFTDIEDTSNVEAVEWLLEVDREKAARFGADVATLGQGVQLLTRGLKLAEYRPATSDEPVDIVVRFPSHERNLDGVMELRIPTAYGDTPIRNFVEIEPSPTTGVIRRVNAERVVTIESDIAGGALAATKTDGLRAAIERAKLPEDVAYEFLGQQEDIQEASRFLLQAFIAAIALMLLVLVAQLNSLYQAFLVMTAILFSITGVFLGLLITDRPFGIVMGGLGMISLAGIVVNNNIVLIDTYNEMRKKGHEPEEAALRTGVQRLRPVFLTSINDILGLLPLVLGLNIDLISRQIQYGAPSTQYWIELSTTVAGGLAFATVMTLILTPCMLLLGHQASQFSVPRFIRRVS
ncbi:efflux RND transporter permease subunit (plasmid) [Peteryoungia desertarenae]|uniref:Efflux RND transporter permease subunit n=1 Tax=Peteryoungia desertarenae TaxID=1813451 RepID=A0ABX6QTR1_9HYPH|nr:efflux RND transporter permease subunit [Peteryoungia desertarenae]QLF71833.1 efflux RND transporter permease subunit [Peteryoungia desertarenae]